MSLLKNTELKESVFCKFNKIETDFIQREIDLKKQHDDWMENGIPDDVFEKAAKSWAKSWSNKIELPKKTRT